MRHGYILVGFIKDAPLTMGLYMMIYDGKRRCIGVSDPTCRVSLTVSTVEG